VSKRKIALQQEKTPMDEQQRKQHIKNTFNTVSQGYDNQALRFFVNSAQQLPAIFNLTGNEHILDVATGTGIAALELARAVPQGKVTGIDFSEGMLTQAKSKAAAQQLPNTEFLAMDMQAMAFADAQFDAANCSFAIFFVEDMPGLLSHMVEKVKPGGQVVCSSFTEGAFQPVQEIFLDHLEEYGIERPPISWKRIASEEKSTELFQQSGLTNVHTRRYNAGYHLENAQQWWDIVWFAGYRGLINQLEPEQVEPFKQQHLAEIQKLATHEGILLDVEVLYTGGTRN
jgi:ubiquinone/menaquinone biosynthesis C-methylase UbiE